jgi:hypothetical protein
MPALSTKTAMENQVSGLSSPFTTPKLSQLRRHIVSGFERTKHPIWHCCKPRRLMSSIKFLPIASMEQRELGDTPHANEMNSVLISWEIL